MGLQTQKRKQTFVIALHPCWPITRRHECVEVCGVSGGSPYAQAFPDDPQKFVPTSLTTTHCPTLATQSIMKAFRIASQLAIEKVRELSVSLEGKSDEEKKSLLKKCAMTTLNSKLVC